MKINRLFNLFAGILIIGLIFSSCEKKTIIPDIPVVDTTVVISFSADIQPIFDDNCVMCHVTGHASGLDLTPGNSYQSIMDNNIVNIDTPNESLIYMKLNNGHYDNASISDYNLILTWITQGALNN
ncbi:MAG: hypothetical protein GXO79_12530 [Chlorobi bacterium]|nr:hypothetical protein [Chlorobiota bacterium]